MRTVRHFSTFARLLCSIHCSPLFPVYPKFIHQSAILTAPIEKPPPAPFARFVKDMFHEVSQLEEKAKTPRVLELIANKWKIMTEEEKEKYTLDYMEERKEWEKNYENSTEEEKVAFKQKKKLKKEMKVKRATVKKRKLNEDPRDNLSKLNSMAIFNYERYYTLRREFPALKQQDLFRLLVHEWKNIPQVSKERYQKMAAAMRAKTKENILVYTFMELYDECYIPRPGESIYY